MGKSSLFSHRALRVLRDTTKEEKATNQKRRSLDHESHELYELHEYTLLIVIPAFAGMTKEA
jgi:hypothetical protein